MNISFPSVVAGIQIGELRKERARIFGVRVEEYIVDEVGYEINEKNASNNRRCKEEVPLSYKGFCNVFAQVDGTSNVWVVQYLRKAQHCERVEVDPGKLEREKEGKEKKYNRHATFKMKKVSVASIYRNLSGARPGISHTILSTDHSPPSTTERLWIAHILPGS
jgi:hypothetical protein